MRTACIQTAIESHVPEILREFGGKEGLHAEEIAKYTGADASKLGEYLVNQPHI